MCDRPYAVYPVGRGTEPSLVGLREPGLDCYASLNEKCKVAS